MVNGTLVGRITGDPLGGRTLVGNGGGTHSNLRGACRARRRKRRGRAYSGHTTFDRGSSVRHAEGDWTLGVARCGVIDHGVSARSALATASSAGVRREGNPAVRRELTLAVGFDPL